jgi:bifunctional protein TilS/HprT
MLMKDVLSYLKKDLSISTKSTLILSISGGPDSMALLALLAKVFPVAVVHFNHLKRLNADQEAELVGDYCKSKDIPFHYFMLEIDGGNFHHRAHQLRNHHLKEVAKLYHTRYILTAHHLDDLLENILIKLTRGSNLLGYAGMQPVYEKDRFTYIKPFLYYSKEDLLSYVQEHDIPFLEDESNEENYYLRNRYRHAIVPVMKQENDALLEQIKQYHLQVTSAFRYIRKQAKTIIKRDKIDVKAFLKEDEAVQDDAIAYLIEKNNLNFSYRVVQKIKSIMASKRPNLTHPLNNRYTFVKSYDEAYVERLKPINQKRVQLQPGKVFFENVAIFTFLDDSDPKTAEATKLCYNKLAFPLWIRHRRDGDLLSYSYGHKKLKKLLIDRKVPLEKRRELLIITDNEDNILYIPGFYQNETLGDENEIFFLVEQEK